MAGFILTIDVLSSISNNALALAASFGELQTTLDDIRTQIETLLLNCTSSEMDEVCGMIPPSNRINTDANYSSVSVLICVVYQLKIVTTTKPELYRAHPLNAHFCDFVCSQGHCYLCANEGGTMHYKPSNSFGSLETLRPEVVPSLCKGSYSLRHSGLYIT